MSMHIKYTNLRQRFRALFWSGDRGKDDINVSALLSELRDFCRADSSCVVVAKDGHIDTHATAVAEGRRECWLKIVTILNISDEQLTRIKEQEQ